MSILRPVDDGSLPWIFVTGGAGYVGSHTVLQLLQDGYSVVVMDNLVNAVAGDGDMKPESLKRIEELTKKTVPFYNVDLSDTTALGAIFAQYTFLGVVHFAALKAVGESCAKPLTYYSNNVAGTINLLQVMNTAGVKNIVFSSSATVYGEPQYLPLDERHPTGQNCTNPYGRTKFFIEEILKDVCKADSAWNALCLRYFNPVGAHPSGRIGEDPQGVPSNLMPFVAQVAVGRRPELRVFGSDYPTIDGTGVRDYIHIMDLAEGHVAAIRKLAASPLGWRAFNLGLGAGYSVLQVVQAFEKASKRPVPVQLSERRPGDVAACYANCSLAEQELGWRATRDLDAMCADMWRWQLANPTGFLATR